MSNPPLATAKTTPPRIRGVLLRERLFALLDETGEFPVTWISAPAGSGKTTLAASYLERKKIPYLWYQVDEGDADIATFFSVLGRAAEKAAPRKRRPLPLLTPEYLPGLPIFTRRYFENLFGRFKPPLVLVLDNYQTLPEESLFHEVFAWAVETVPEGIRIVVITRRNPPAVLSRLQANGLMQIIGWDRVRLTLEETVGIIPLKCADIPSREVVEELHQAADGWVAGLVLMLESLKRGGGPTGHETLAREDIIDYFGNELFNKTDEPTRDFLLRTAFLPKITLKGAQTLTGLTRAESLLSQLNRNNYFTERHYSPEPLYQYHPLFREFLLSRARELFSREELTSLLRQAATLLVEDGQINDALAFYQELGDWPSRVQLILKEAPAILAQGRYRTLEGWLDSFPRDLVEQDPWLLYLKGTARFPFDPSQAQSDLEQAFDRFTVQENLPGALLAWAGVAYSIIYRFEEYLSLDRWIERFPVLPEESEKTIPLEIWIQVVSSMFISRSYREPVHPETMTWIRRAEAIVQRPGNPAVQIQILLQLVHYYLGIGNFEQAALGVRSMQHLAQSENALPLTIIMTRLAEAMYYGLVSNDERCLQAVSDGLGVSDSNGIYLLKYVIMTQGVSCYQNRGDLDLAGTLLRKLDEAAGRLKPFEKGLHGFVLTRQFLLQSDWSAAAAQIESTLKINHEVGIHDGSCMSHQLAALVYYGAGKRREAWRQLREARLINEVIHSSVFEFYSLMIEAYFYLDRGKEPPGLAALRQALSLGRERRFLNTYVDQPSVTAQLCVKALEEGIEVPYVQEIIRKRGLAPEKPPLHLENWPWPIQIYTLGRFELLQDGKPPAFSRKAQKKPLLLLKALVALGGKGVDEERLMDYLWPEADGDQAYNTLTTTLFRLRRLLGEPVLEVRTGKVTLSPRHCWVDVWAFEDLAGEAKASFGEGVLHSENRRGLEKAVALYRGPFLVGEDPGCYWLVPLRERLKGRYLDLVGRLGRSLEQEEQWGQAVTLYRKGLEVDNLAEDLYRCLMDCYGKLGEPVKAVRVYLDLKATLGAVLGVEPSPKTEKLYRELTGPKRNRWDGSAAPG